MGSIADYAELLSIAAGYSGRDDWVVEYDRFLRATENKVNKLVRALDMTDTATLVATGGMATLPADFLEFSDIRVRGYAPLMARPLSYLNSLTGAIPVGYTVVMDGGVRKVRLGPSWDGSNLDITYYTGIPPLTAAAPTNWLLEQESEIYLYGVCEQAAIWATLGNRGGSAEQVAAANQLMQGALDGLTLSDTLLRMSMQRVTVGGYTP